MYTRTRKHTHTHIVHIHTQHTQTARVSQVFLSSFPTPLLDSPDVLPTPAPPPAHPYFAVRPRVCAPLLARGALLARLDGRLTCHFQTRQPAHPYAPLLRPSSTPCSRWWCRSWTATTCASSRTARYARLDAPAPRATQAHPTNAPTPTPIHIRYPSRRARARPSRSKARRATPACRRAPSESSSASWVNALTGPRPSP